MNRPTPPLIDHDRLFKELLTTLFVPFLELFFPAMLAYLDQDSITFLDKEVFTDVSESEELVADIVARVRFLPGAAQGNGDGFFLIHIENQSTARSDMSKRMYRYFGRFYDKYDVPIYPIVVFSYDEPRRPEPDTFTLDFPHFTPLRFQYRVVQLNQLNWRDYAGRPNPAASALMAKMRIAPEDRWRVKLECLRLLATLRLDRARMRLISSFVDSYLRLTRAENQALTQAANTAGVLTLEEQEVALELTTSWKEEGVQEGFDLGLAEGVQQGMQQGMQQGERQAQERLVLRQLTRRVGELPEAAEIQVRGLESDALDALADALLDFTGPDDFTGWLAARAS